MAGRKRLWGGRFKGGPGPELREIGDSFAYDVRLLADDLIASMAHARMLGQTGIIPRGDASKIVKGLRGMLKDLAAGKLSLKDRGDEDVHAFVERVLVERIGKAGLRLHTARSRNDLVATDLRMWCRDEIEEIRGEIRALAGALAEAAGRAGSLIVPAYTHLQRGQPVLLAHHVLAHAEALLRDDGRLADAVKRADECPMGSGAATGTPFPVDRKAVAEELDFARPSRNSMDAVSDRDFAVELLSAAALSMVHLSRLSEDVILWTSREFGFASLDDSVSTGSSIMPQKRNPDPAELVRGKTGRVTGALVALLTTLKGLPLTYNRDLQEDKEPLFDAVDSWRVSLRAAAALMRGLSWNVEACEASLDEGFLEATELADHLVEQGVPFREAHDAAGKVVMLCEKRGERLRDLTLADLRSVDKRFKKSVLNRLDPHGAVASRSHVGGTAPKRVRENLRRIRRFAEGG